MPAGCLVVAVAASAAAAAILSVDTISHIVNPDLVQNLWSIISLGSRPRFELSPAWYPD